MNDEASCARNAGGYMIAFTVGAILGAGLALLYAPRSGKETREMLAQKGRELKDKADEKREDAQAFIERKKAEFAAAVEAGKQAIRDERTKHQPSA